MNVRRDPVAADLRAAERVIDGCYQTNTLLSSPRATAMWYALAFVEERTLKHFLTEDDDSNAAAFADALVVHLKWPLVWLYGGCNPGGEAPNTYDQNLYQAAWELSDLSGKYTQFETAYTWATLEKATLALNNQVISVTGPIRSDTTYEAYDRLTSPRGVDLGSLPEALELLSHVARLVKVRGDRFTYKLERRDLQRALAAFEPYLAPRFTLPIDWVFPSFSISDFVAVAETLLTLGIIHFHARLIAARSGCQGLGFLDSVLLFEPQELFRKLKRYSGVDDANLGAIIDALTYGGAGIQSPDPALQPIVPIGTKLALAPGLLNHSDMERNLTVLLNRMPNQRDAYSRLSQGREAKLRGKLEAAAAAIGLRTWYGNVAGWGNAAEVDLAIVDDAHGQCLLLELKSFIGPAEPREIRDRTTEIEHGVGQILARKALLTTNRAEFLHATNAGATVDVTCAVVSETSIGASWAQDVNVPVVRASHFLKKLSADGLRATCDWLMARQHLPRQGEHYEAVPVTLEVAGYSLEWYGIDTLVEEMS